MGIKNFIHDDFLLEYPFSKKLYHDHAAALPIIDFHNHLPPKKIADNHRYENITRAWLEGDHYKWRAMRSLGISEDYITGNADDSDKFRKWAETVPFTMRNPLYHWTHLELKRYFGIDDLLSPANAGEIFDSTGRQLQQATHSALGLLTAMRVEVVCTSDDPADGLEDHQRLQQRGVAPKVLPTFRPDRVYDTGDPLIFLHYLETLEQVSGTTIRNFSELLAVLQSRVAYFHSHGCRMADHGLEHLPPDPGENSDPEVLFKKLRNKERLSAGEDGQFKFHLLRPLCRAYHARGWVQQFHLGALRNNNSRMLRSLGKDSGFDSIGDFPQAQSLSRFLDALDNEGQLARTIIYNLNPADNEVMATMAGNFSDGSIRGKVQWGAAWWFLDQKDGMERQLNTLSNMGLLSCFVGMLTDSRSFLSFPRHEYFRRILCNLIGRDVANGELPADEAWLGQMVRDICYGNARNYFPF